MKLLKISAIISVVLMSQLKADEIDPKVVLQKTISASSELKTYKADFVVESFASLKPQTGVIYKKLMSDGTTTMRMEINVPNIGESDLPGSHISEGGGVYTLIKEEGAYTVIGNKAIKVNDMPGIDVLKNTMNPSVLKRLTSGTETNNTITSDKVDGNECWIISQQILPPTFNSEKISSVEGAQKNPIESTKIRETAIPIPAKIMIYVDKQSSLILKQEIRDINGKIIHSMSYHNILTNLDLGDRLFELPKNIQIEDITSLIKK